MYVWDGIDVLVFGNIIDIEYGWENLYKIDLFVVYVKYYYFMLDVIKN